MFYAIAINAARREIYGQKAYALTNPMEYFAETTEALFTRNDFFPFTKEELEKHDPEMFELLNKVWGISK